MAKEDGKIKAIANVFRNKGEEKELGSFFYKAKKFRKKFFSEDTSAGSAFENIKSTGNKVYKIGKPEDNEEPKEQQEPIQKEPETQPEPEKAVAKKKVNYDDILGKFDGKEERQEAKRTTQPIAKATKKKILQKKSNVKPSSTRKIAQSKVRNKAKIAKPLTKPSGIKSTPKKASKPMVETTDAEHEQQQEADKKAQERLKEKEKARKAREHSKSELKKQRLEQKYKKVEEIHMQKLEGQRKHLEDRKKKLEFKLKKAEEHKARDVERQKQEELDTEIIADMKAGHLAREKKIAEEEKNIKRLEEQLTLAEQKLENLNPHSLPNKGWGMTIFLSVAGTFLAFYLTLIILSFFGRGLMGYTVVW
jgi:hypothetical protein